MTVDEASCSSLWSKEQDKAFENAIATCPEDDFDRWEKIAADVAGKTVDEIKHHYELLVDDINQIEAGCVPLPTYSSSEGSSSHGGDEGTSKNSDHGSKASKSEQERRKGIAWTEDEHRLFLLGLEKYGKGDWRSISRNFVAKRTPTQVASHAQKYFIRLNSMNKDRRRSSIHDITSVGNADVAAPPGPTTGQTNGGSPSAKASKQLAGVGMYGAAVGTPVNISGAGHMAYGVRAPVNMGHMTYPTTAHR